MLSVLMIFVAFLSTPSSAAAINDTIYCAKDLCPSGYQPHIACGNSGNFSSTCPSDRQLLVLTKDNIYKILESHNSFRNIVASGKQSGLNSAAKMKTLVRKHSL